jgi:hypothetical protein
VETICTLAVAFRSSSYPLTSFMEFFHEPGAFKSRQFNNMPWHHCPVGMQ